MIPPDSKQPEENGDHEPARPVPPFSEKIHGNGNGNGDGDDDGNGYDEEPNAGSVHWADMQMIVDRPALSQTQIDVPANAERLFRLHIALRIPASNTALRDMLGGKAKLNGMGQPVPAGFYGDEFGATLMKLADDSSMATTIPMPQALRLFLRDCARGWAEGDRVRLLGGWDFAIRYKGLVPETKPEGVVYEKFDHANFEMYVDLQLTIGLSAADKQAVWECLFTDLRYNPVFTSAKTRARDVVLAGAGNRDDLTCARAIVDYLAD